MNPCTKKTLEVVVNNFYKRNTKDSFILGVKEIDMEVLTFLAERIAEVENIYFVECSFTKEYLDFYAFTNLRFIALKECNGNPVDILPKFNGVNEVNLLKIEGTNLESVEDFTFLNNFPKLKILYLSRFRHVSLANLESDSLVEMRIGADTIELKEGNKRENLKEIYLDGFQGKDLKVFDRFSSIELLSLTSSKISSLNGIESLKHLYTLIIKKTIPALKEIYFPHLLNLKCFTLSESSVYNINVTGLPSLTLLSITKSKLLSIDLTKSSELQFLLLSDNCLQELSISINTKVYWIDLSNNLLRNLFIPIGIAKDLEVLNLQDNLLSIEILSYYRELLNDNLKE